MICKKGEDGKQIDKSTWDDVNYEPLIIDAWKEIFIHSSHQQRCENYVQLTGLLSKTGVAEVRRSCRAIMISTLIRRFNAWGLKEKNKMQKKKGEKPVARLQGSDKTHLFLKFSDIVFARADKAKASLKMKELADGKEIGSTFKGIHERLGSEKSKASAAETQKKLFNFEKSLRQAPKEYKAELAEGIEKTARVNGGVFLRILTKTNKMSDVVNAEIKARNIKVSKKKLESLTIAERRKLLRKDEHKNRIGEALKEADIQYIKPVSKEMINVLTNNIQQKILDREAGILTLEEGE